MPTPKRTHLSDIRGASRMVIDATAGVTGIVENMHRTIQLRPWPLGRATEEGARGLTGLIYRSIRGGMRLVGRGIDASLAPVEAFLPEGESTPGRDAFLSVVNGVYGDYLDRTANPLAIDMSLRYRGRLVDPENPTMLIGQDRDAAPTGRLLVFAHGLCLNERHWAREGYDHGMALAEELGYTPLHLRYNSGLRVARNGRALAEALDTLIGNWPQPVHELVIIGYSMGGLVARSACRHAQDEGHAWLGHLRKLVFLGTPHHGAPLERGGHWLDAVVELSPYSAPLARIGKRRSAGITDLGHGSITTGTHEFVPLPADAKCYAVAATRGARRSMLAERLIGDGLVPLHSALGRHADAAQTLAIPESRQWVGYRMGHFELLHRPEVYAQLRRWLAGE